MQVHEKYVITDVYICCCWKWH